MLGPQNLALGLLPRRGGQVELKHLGESCVSHLWLIRPPPFLRAVVIARCRPFSECSALAHFDVSFYVTPYARGPPPPPFPSYLTVLTRSHSISSPPVPSPPVPRPASQPNGFPSPPRNNPVDSNR